MVDPENTGSVQMLLRFYLHLLVHFYKEKASSDLLETGSFLVPQVGQSGRHQRAMGNRKLARCNPLLDVNEAQDSQQAFVHRFPAVDYQLPNVWLLDDGHPFRTPSPCEVEWFCTR